MNSEEQNQSLSQFGKLLAGSIRRPCAQSDKKFTNADSRWMVHFQKKNSSPTSWRQTHNISAIKRKVLHPSVSTRVKELNQAQPIGIQRSDVRTLVKIATVASQRKVLQRISAAMLKGDDMLHMHGPLKHVSTQPTVFAAVSRPVTHHDFRRCVHHSGGRLQFQLGLQPQHAKNIRHRDALLILSTFVGCEKTFIRLGREFIKALHHFRSPLLCRDSLKRLRRKTTRHRIQHSVYDVRGMFLSIH